ncbi:mitochondrial carrier protein, putative [Pediculus humanus corporis]|uniref:Mitochondrial glycine transporter n=1 Tax=Pediculus humanus subsp. corporis TaxID=121224 RepID=E0VM89_PEDHC|nr:mitochondrial carrier protein, putative [Pediculus humanus corporis]EEB14495.1 mitochondrial carrier protein, putative [Pediculus humanus corporis]
MRFKLFKSFAAGAISGTCSTVIFQPLDLVKTRLQNTNVGPKISNVQNEGAFSIVLNILQHEKLSGLWRGMTPSLVRCVPGVGIYFSTLHELKSKWISHTGNLSLNPLEAIILGISARSVSGICLMPFTVIKTRYESGIYTYNGMLSALNVIYKGEGLRGLCRGLVPTLFRDAPFSGLYLMFYTQTKQALPEKWLDGNTASPLHFTCGIIAGILASLVTQPADVIKTKMQLYPGEFSSVKSVIIYLQKRDGVSGYFKGLVPRMLRRTLMSAMAWTIYERITQKFGLK